MKKIFLAFTMLLSGVVVNAADIKLANSNFEVLAGSSIVIPIQLDLEAAEVGLYKTFQLDATLSNSEFKMEEVTMASERQTMADSQYDKVIAGKTFGIVGKKDAAVITGASGDFLYLTVSAGAATEGETCTITFSKAKGGDIDGHETDATISTASITITVTNTLTLSENSTTAITAQSGINVKVERTIPADTWSTIVLPFTVTKATADAQFGSGQYQLATYTNYESEYESDEDMTPDGITVNFATYTLSSGKGAKSMVAGTPYLIKVDHDITEINATGVDVVSSVTSVSGADVNFSELTGAFTGTFVKTTVPAWGLFISNEKFYYSQGSSSGEGNTVIKGFRGWFSFDAILDKVPDAWNEVKMCIDGEDLTAIDGINAELKTGKVYTIDGKYVGDNIDLNRMQKGIYIVNGKKVINK